jgi:hypothetical protein
MSPLEGLMSPLEGLMSPLEGLISPLEPLISPLEPLMSPLEPLMSPLEPLISPLEPLMSPLEGLMSPLEGLISPLEGLMSPLEGLMSPLEGLMSPLEGLMSPFCITLCHSEGNFQNRKDSFGMTKRDTKIPSEGQNWNKDSLHQAETRCKLSFRQTKGIEITFRYSIFESIDLDHSKVSQCTCLYRYLKYQLALNCTFVQSQCLAFYFSTQYIRNG